MVRALARQLVPGGRLLLREPQREGLTREELERITRAAGLECGAIDAHKIVIGAVYDGCFIRPKVGTAAQALRQDYQTDEELTAFQALDGDDFQAPQDGR